MLPPTFAPCVLTFAPYNLTFRLCACGVSLLSTGANIPLAQVVVVTSCNLRSWCFFIQPLAQIVHLHTWWYHPLQLALVVLFHSPTGANTALAPGQLALCGGGQWWYIYIYIYIYICIYTRTHTHTHAHTHTHTHVPTAQENAQKQLQTCTASRYYHLYTKCDDSCGYSKLKSCSFEQARVTLGAPFVQTISKRNRAC